MRGSSQAEGVRRENCILGPLRAEAMEEGSPEGALIMEVTPAGGDALMRRGWCMGDSPVRAPLTCQNPLPPIPFPFSPLTFQNPPSHNPLPLLSSYLSESPSQNPLPLLSSYLPESPFPFLINSTRSRRLKSREDSVCRDEVTPAQSRETRKEKRGRGDNGE